MIATAEYEMAAFNQTARLIHRDGAESCQSIFEDRKLFLLESEYIAPALSGFFICKLGT